MSGEKGGLGYFGFSYFEENQDTLKARRDRRRRRLRRAERRDRAGRHLQAALAPALRLREEGVAVAAGGRGVPAVHPRQRAGRSPRRRSSCRSPTSSSTKAKTRPRRRHRGLVGVDRDHRGRGASAPRPRRRLGEDVVKGLLGVCALISVATTVGIVIALFVPAFEFFQEVSIVDFLTGTEWAPLFEPAQLRRAAADRGHAARDADREHRRDAARARRGDLPERVRVAARARDPQAGARDPGGHPDDRLRLLRAHVHDAAAARPRDRGGHLQHAVRRARDGRDADADRRVALRGRDGRGAARPARRRLRARLDEGAGGDEDRRPGRRLRASSPRSCSRSRARSARR